MARQAQRLSTGTDNTLHLSAGVIGMAYPASQIALFIEQCGRHSRRVRDLPAIVVFYYVLALSLFPSTGYQDTLRWLLCGLQWLGAGAFRLSGKGSLSRARQRLGADPLRRCFEQMARPLCDRALPGSYWKGWHVVALDGSTVALQDTCANEADFGRSSNQNGSGAYPQARFVVLVETGTHLVFAAQIGRYQQSELSLARSVLAQLRPGMLCLADRLFPGYELWQEARTTGAHLLWRAKENVQLKRTETLADGSWLAQWPTPKSAKEQSPLIVRVIEYRLRAAADATRYRLITSITDPAQASAEELARFYPQRWEVELSIKESKTVLRQGALTLRSKIPELVRQEFWGLLLAHNMVRKMMAQAAQVARADPDLISYKASVEILRIAQTGPVLSFSPSAKSAAPPAHPTANRRQPSKQQPRQTKSPNHQKQTPPKVPRASKGNQSSC